MAATEDELEALLARTALGDRTAFHRLYDETSARVYGVINAMLRDGDLANDVLQDTYVKVWGRASEFHAERGLVLSWIIAIARYRALDLLRAAKRRTTLELQSDPFLQADDFGDEVGDDVGLNGLSGLLDECLERLAGIQRKSIVAAFVHGYTHEELAQREDAPLGTIKSRIRRGLARLKECLEQ